MCSEAVHEVDADVGNARTPQPRDGQAHLCRAMAAAQEAQSRLVECLCAHAHPVHRQAGEGQRILFGHVVRVALNGHFLGPARVDGGKQAVKQGGGELARRAPTYIYGGGRRADVATAQLQFGSEGVDIALGSLAAGS